MKTHVWCHHLKASEISPAALPGPGADTDAEDEEEEESFPGAAADSSWWELPSPPRSLSSSYSRGRQEGSYIDLSLSPANSFAFVAPKLRLV